MRKRFAAWWLALALLGSPAAVHGQSLFRTTSLDDLFGDRAPTQVPELTQARGIVRAQDNANNYDYEVVPTIFTGPLSHPRYETGGFYAGLEFLYFIQNRPILNQLVAVRGFFDVDGSITGTPGTFVGSGQEALNTSQVRGTGNFQPGFNAFAGWRFENGVTVELAWWHLQESRYSASASTIPPELNVGGKLENTFLFSPVTNFPPEFAGATQNLAVGNPGATYGIWNAAETEQIQFIQRFDLWQVNTRMPVWQTENFRCYGLFGPRLVTQWERFSWRTISSDPIGQTDPSMVGNYFNTVSNRLYGAYLGCGSDWFLGDTPVGAFSFTSEFDAGLYIDLAKGRAGYSTEIRTIEVHRARNLSTLVPGGTAKFNLRWHPWEAITLQVGYDALLFLNTVASRYPIDFNMGTVDPQYDTGISRFIQGLNMGISFVF